MAGPSSNDTLTLLLLSKPEKPLFVMQSMRGAAASEVLDRIKNLQPVDRAGDISELRDRPLHHLQSLARPQQAIVAQGSNLGIRPRGIGHKSADKVLPDFARRTGDQDDLALFAAHPIPFSFNARLPSFIFSNCSRIGPRS